MILSDSDINALLIDFLGKFQQPYSYKIHTLYVSLFQHGFRLSELSNINRFKAISDTQIICQTSKGGGIRVIDKVDIEALLLLSIEKQENYFFDMSLRSYERIFREKVRATNLRVKDKGISTHLFRHNRMKTLVNEGNTETEIQGIMGLKRLSTVAEYTNSSIFADEYFL